MEINDEDLLKQFFREHTFEVEDNGFTHQVMRRLSRKTVLYNRIWTGFCAVLGIILFVMGGAYKQLIVGLRTILVEVFVAISTSHFDISTLISIYLSIFMLTALVGYRALKNL